MGIKKKESATLPTEYGEFRITVYEDEKGLQHAAVSKNIERMDTALVRIHSECLTGDAFHSLKCDCQKQLEAALRQVNRENGVLLYLRQEGRGIGLLNKIKAYKLQEQGMDTVEANEKLGFKADQRDYAIAVRMLLDLGIKKIRLLTNNPKKIEGLQKYGLSITERVPLITKPTRQNIKYLETKKKKLGHFFE